MLEVEWQVTARTAEKTEVRGAETEGGGIHTHARGPLERTGILFGCRSGGGFGRAGAILDRGLMSARVRGRHAAASGDLARVRWERKRAGPGRGR